MRNMCKLRRISCLVVLPLLIPHLLILSLTIAAEDLDKSIAALKQEMKSAQGKLDKAKAGDTLEKITLPVSIKNMQMFLQSLTQKANTDPSLAAKTKILGNSLIALERAKDKNDKSGAQRILNEMSVKLMALETEVNQKGIASVEAQTKIKGPTPVTAKDTSGLLKAPTPSLKIASFRKCIEPGTVAAQARKSGEPAPEVTSTTINIGEEVCLSWRIEGCHVGSVTERLTAGAGSTINVDPGTRVDEERGCFRMSNQKRLIPDDTATYTLSVSGLPVMPGASASKTFTVNVRRPRLVALQPEVNLRNLRVKFFVSNNGELDLESVPITVRYQIVGTGGRERTGLDDVSFTTSNMTIRRGQRVDLGERSLPSRSTLSSYSGMDLEVQITFRTTGLGSIPSGWTRFSYSLAPSERSISSNLISAFGSALSGEIRLNNYDRSVTSETVRRMPVVTNDSYIDIAGNRSVFSIDYIHLRVTVGTISRRYLAFINNLTAPIGRRIGGRDFLSVVDGKLKMHIVFDTSGGREIKGWLQDLFDPDLWNDEQGPDIDIRRLEMDVHLTLGLRAGRITYTEVQVEPNVSLHVAGGWEFIDPLVRERLQNTFRSEVRTQLSSLMMRDTIRGSIEDQLANSLREIGIDRIETLRVEGERIIITCRW